MWPFPFHCVQSLSVHSKQKHGMEVGEDDRETVTGDRAQKKSMTEDRDKAVGMENRWAVAGSLCLYLSHPMLNGPV